MKWSRIVSKTESCTECTTLSIGIANKSKGFINHERSGAEKEQFRPMCLKRVVLKGYEWNDVYQILLNHLGPELSELDGVRK